jgi:hypothetical protein
MPDLLPARLVFQSSGINVILRDAFNDWVLQSLPNSLLRWSIISIIKCVTVTLTEFATSAVTGRLPTNGPINNAMIYQIIGKYINNKYINKNLGTAEAIPKDIARKETNYWTRILQIALTMRKADLSHIRV